MQLHKQTVERPTKALRPSGKAAVSLSKSLLQTLKTHPLVDVIDAVDVKSGRVSCTNETGKLKKAVVSLPTHLDWDEAINVAEAKNLNNKPDRLLAVSEHAELILTLLAHNVHVVIITPSSDKPEGVYTRDIAVVIGDNCIQANMVAKPRWSEEDSITGGIKPPSEVMIEGGNVLVDSDKVFLGIGDRTNMAAKIWLQELLGTTFEVVPVHLHPGILHLDCAFSPIAKPNGTAGGALVYAPAFVNHGDLKLFQKIYGRIFEIGAGEYEKLGLNTFALGPKTRIVTPGAPTVVSILEQELHQLVVPVSLDEIVKGEGYARCSIMPLLRE